MLDVHPGLHGVAFGPGSPSRSTTGSHELEDTYGAYRLRSDPPVILGGGSGLRHTVGSVAPSSLWLEHRAAAHHTASGEQTCFHRNPDTCTSFVREAGALLHWPAAFWGFTGSVKVLKGPCRQCTRLVAAAVGGDAAQNVNLMLNTDMFLQGPCGAM
jgi:hypothetical protein